METGRMQALITQAKSGKRSAFDELVAEHRERLEALIGSRLGERLRARLEVEDILQETLLRAFRSLAKFEWRKDDAFFSWLAGIVEHVVRTAAGREKKSDSIQLKRDPAGARVSPSKVMRRNERFDRLQSSLASLSDEHRQVILLARIEGLRVDEIALRMDRSSEAVKKLLSRALRKLGTSFGDTESLHLPDRRLTGDVIDEE